MSELSEIVEKSLLAKSIVDHLLISPEHKILIDGDSTGTRSEGLLFVVGVKSLEAHDKEAVLKIFKELHENEEIFFPQKKEDDYQEYKKYSSHNQKDKNTLSYFEKVIPGQDLRALQVSMFLRVKALRGRNIYGDKNDIRLWFGKRGAHIANLCSAGYFENEFMQMHKTETTEDFNTYYELAVGQEALAQEQNREFEEQIKKQEEQPVDENIFQEMGDKVKRYKVKETYKELIDNIVFPQFFIKVTASDIFGTDEEILNRESLLKDFRLSDEDIKIDFDQISSDLYKVDLEAKNEYRPSFTKIEENEIKDPIAEYILAKPKESQISDITHQLMQVIGNMYPIPDQEIKVYISRILKGMNTEQLRDILVRKWSYTDKIKTKIRQLADTYAENRFMDLIKSKKISTKENWKLGAEIVPGNTGSSIGNSLYEKEGSMNNFEERVAMELGTSSNIEFWHRNLERGKGFYINGFKANHYPDFIMRTKSGKTILVETKGDHLDNTDSSAKCRLGNEWEKQAGSEFAYFMIFDKKEVDGAYTLDKAKELISKM